MARIVFVQNIFREYPAYMALAADLKQYGHYAGVVIARGERDVVSAIVLHRPDIVGFSPSAYDIEWCLHISRELKKIGINVILGGAMVTAKQDVINDDAIDFICVGEGELCMRHLFSLKSIKNSCKAFETVPNLVYKKGGEVLFNPIAPMLEDLDSLSMPDHSIYQKYPQLAKSSTGIFTFMRGCKFNCSFCYNHVLQNLYRSKPYIVRRRSPELSIGEIEETIVARKGAVKILRLFDSSLLSEPAWVKEFLDLYRKRVSLPFVCFAHPSEISYEMSRALKASGCIEVGFSIESGSPYIRNQVLRKGISEKQILSAVDALKKSGLFFVTFNMLGSPGESWEQILETIEVNNKIEPTIAWGSLTQVYRGTTLEDMALKLEPTQVMMDEKYGLLNYSSKINARIILLAGAFSFIVRYPRFTRFILGRNYTGSIILMKIMALISFFMQIRRPALSFKEFVRHYIVEDGHGTGYY